MKMMTFLDHDLDINALVSPC